MTSIFQKTALMAALSAILILNACQKQPAQSTSEQGQNQSQSQNQTEPKTDELANLSNPQKLLTSYANMAQAAYQDSLDEAKKLQQAIDTFVSEPTQANLDLAKKAYEMARLPYSQTEVFRFDEGFVGKNDKRKIESVDAWEAQVNAWPLDEALIDYVNDDYEGEYNSKNNIINSDSIQVGSSQEDTKTITPELLAKMNEIGGSEANVTSGYHAIEFLLWGQDTHGVGEGAGERPVSDYAKDNTCTSGKTVNQDATICQKRGDYLKAAAQLLVDDLTDMVGEWQKDSQDTLRSDLLARADDNAVRQVLYQMGSLALGELASERMQVAFVTGSTEDEHECFSDLTHDSYTQNAQGIRNLFDGNYQSVAGKLVGGYGVKQFLMDLGKQTEADELSAQFDKVSQAFAVISQQAKNNGIKIDQMIATVAQASKVGVSADEQNKRRAWIKDAITELQALTASIEKSAAAAGIDNLDADSGSQF